MVEMRVLGSREEWLKARANTIGGSDASAIVGMNPYKSNVDLWMEKTGQIIPEDVSEKPCVKFGTEAEYYMRELFKLDFPEYQVFYEENNLWLNDKYPWGHYSADGWLRDKDGRLGVFENKTTNIVQSMQKEKWSGNHLPDNYYIQCLQGLLILEADFAVLKARLRYDFKNSIYATVKYYHIERSEVQEDIDYLMQEGGKFWRYVQSRTKPALILPNI